VTAPNILDRLGFGKLALSVPLMYLYFLNLKTQELNAGKVESIGGKAESWIAKDSGQC
jgi:hypothetical protein